MKNFNKNKQSNHIKHLARTLEPGLKTEVLWAAREHMITEKFPAWKMPGNHSLLKSQSKDNVKAIQQIWHEVIAYGSK